MTGACYPVQDAFRRFYPAYREGHAVTPEQESAAQCIMGCKTGKYGFTESTCEECGHKAIHYGSCGKRDCPCCGAAKAEEWVAARNAELVEGIPYFHVVMTVPHELNPLFLPNMKAMCGLLLQSASAAVLDVSLRERNLGAVPGAVSVLHTWSSTMAFHPHVHMLISGGGLKDPAGFEKAVGGFFLPARQLAGAFRGKLIDGIKRLRADGGLGYAGSSSPLADEGAWQSLLTVLYAKEWNVFLKETFNGNGNAVKYLSRYAYRTAISNGRIIRVTDTSVFIRWRDYRDGGTLKEMELDGVEFVRRFLMHVLPKGFTRIRFSGFLSNSQKKERLRQIRRILKAATPMSLQEWRSERRRRLEAAGPWACPCCGGPMLFTRERFPQRE